MKEKEYLDFSRESEKPLNERKENYYKCIDYSLDIISTLIDVSLKNIQDHPFIVFLGKFFLKIKILINQT